MHAVCRPFCGEAEGGAQAGAAGADHDHVVLVFGDLVGGHAARIERSGQQRDADDRVHARERAEDADEVDGDLQRELEPRACARSPRSPPAGRASRARTARSRTTANSIALNGLASVALHACRDRRRRTTPASRPARHQQRQHDRGDALPPEMAGAGLGRTQAAGAPDRRAEILLAASASRHRRRSCPTPQCEEPDQRGQHDRQRRRPPSRSDRPRGSRSPSRYPTAGGGCR